MDVHFVVVVIAVIVVYIHVSSMTNLFLCAITVLGHVLFKLRGVCIRRATSARVLGIPEMETKLEKKRPSHVKTDFSWVLRHYDRYVC